jgi:hypothetical protein
MRFTLKRHQQSDYATYGRLFDETGKVVCVTLERPWVDADHNGKRDEGMSRFVPGTYRVILRRSKDDPVKRGTGKRVYAVPELVDVPDCQHAQMHRANLPRDLHGCVGMGKAFTDLPDPDLHDKLMPGISGSKVTFEDFMTQFDLNALEEGDYLFDLEVIDAF